MKTVTISDNQYDFLEQITKLMETQNNRGTQYPLFYVYEKSEIQVDSGESWDRKVWYNDDYEEVATMNAENFDEEKEEELDNIYQQSAYLKEQNSPIVNVGPFLTEDACNHHIKSNDYHYNKPFSYVNSAWRNYELQMLLQLIFNLVGKNIPMQYK